jgi:PAS domain S-box-containing protein
VVSVFGRSHAEGGFRGVVDTSRNPNRVSPIAAAMGTQQTPLRPFPFCQALLILATGVVLYVLLGWLLLAANQTSRQLRDEALVAVNVIDDIRLETGQLQALALLAASSGEQVFLARYRDHRHALDTDFTRLTALSRRAPKLVEDARILAAYAPLGAMEQQALALVERQETAAALNLLRGSDYETGQEALRRYLNVCDEDMEARADAALASQAGSTQTALWCIAAFLPILVIGGLTLAIRARRNVRANIEAQAALAESERRFRGTFELAAVGIAHVGLDGHFLRTNARFSAITGYPPQALSGLTFEAITHPDDLLATRERLDQLIRGAIPAYSMEKRYIRPDGSPTWVNLTVSLVRDETGHPEYRINVIEDISERKKAEAALSESAQTISALLDATTDRVFLADQDGRILAINAAGAKGLDLSQAEAVGRTFYDLFAGELARSRMEHLRRALETGTSQRFTDERGGVLFDHIMTPLPGIDGVSHRVALFARDVTDLIRAREAAEAASKAKSSFLANMGHELRTPLNGILGMGQVLAGSELDAQQRLCLEDLNTAASGLLALVNALLDLSTLEAGHLELAHELFVLDSILQSVSSALGPLAREKGLRFSIDIGKDVPQLLLGDGDKLRQVLLNLTDNAVKFTKEGLVRVAVRCSEACPAWEDAAPAVTLCFRIEDTGIGIAATDQARVFESFTQADGSSTRRFGGTGLGLAISKRLVDLMGGDITLQSEPGRGSVFSCTIRFALPEVQPDDGTNV